jgi:hypothetical protein
MSVTMPETFEEYRRHERREMARIEAETMSRPARRRPRKPNLDKLIAKAKAAGATSVLVDGVEMKFGAPGAATSSGDPWQAEKCAGNAVQGHDH